MKRIYIGMAALLVSAIGANADDWATWRGPSRNGISTETNWNAEAVSKLTIKWETALGDGFSAVSVESGKLYTMGNIDENDIIYCLDAKTGKEIWRHTYSCKSGKFKGPRSTPVVHGERLVVISRSGRVTCFDKTNGKVLWTTEMKGFGVEEPKWGHATSPVIYKDLVLFGLGKSGIALDVKTGKKVWGESGLGNYASATIMSCKGQDIALIWGKDHLYAMNPKTGDEFWNYNWVTTRSCNAADAVPIGEDKVFISSGYNHGCALLDISSGRPKKLWENQNLMTQFGTAIYLDGLIYGFSGQAKKAKEMICLDPKNGAVAWKKKIGYGSMMVADGRVIILSETGSKGTLRVAEVSGGAYKELAAKETTLRKPCWTYPVLSNGIIYCRDTKGTLLAVDVSK